MSEKVYRIFVKLSKLTEHWIQKSCVKILSILNCMLTAKDNAKIGNFPNKVAVSLMKQGDIHNPESINRRYHYHRSICVFVFQTPLEIHSFSILSDDRFKASSKTIPPHSAI
jgi:hypothetical protein